MSLVHNFVDKRHDGVSHMTALPCLHCVFMYLFIFSCYLNLHQGCIEMLHKPFQKRETFNCYMITDERSIRCTLANMKRRAIWALVVIFSDSCHAANFMGLNRLTFYLIPSVSIKKHHATSRINIFPFYFCPSNKMAKSGDRRKLANSFTTYAGQFLTPWGGFLTRQARVEHWRAVFLRLTSPRKRAKGFLDPCWSSSHGATKATKRRTPPQHLSWLRLCQVEMVGVSD